MSLSLLLSLLLCVVGGDVGVVVIVVVVCVVVVVVIVIVIVIRFTIPVVGAIGYAITLPGWPPPPDKSNAPQSEGSHVAS